MFFSFQVFMAENVSRPSNWTTGVDIPIGIQSATHTTTSHHHGNNTQQQQQHQQQQSHQQMVQYQQQIPPQPPPPATPPSQHQQINQVRLFSFFLFVVIDSLFYYVCFV